LPEEYQIWLEKPQWGYSPKTWVFYEGELWAKTVATDFPGGEKKLLHIILQEVQSCLIVNKLPILKNAPIESPNKILTISLLDEGPIYAASYHGIYILFSVFKSVHIKLPESYKIYIPNRNIIFLFNAYKQKPSASDIQNLISHNVAFINEKEPSFDTIAAHAKRVYPDHYLFVEAIWTDIEEEANTHLALSAEEEAILASILAPEGSDSSLPVYINGRAGSGKSTVLIYLFSAVLCHVLEKSRTNGGLNDHIPLFLSYSPELVNTAREKIHKLLKTREFELSEHELKKIVRPFREIMVSCLPFEEDSRFYRIEQNDAGNSIRRVNDNKLIRFHDFREFYSKRYPVKENINADICWYVIRTYIKGYIQDKYLTYDEYTNLVGRKAQLEGLLRQDYERIYRVFEVYQKYLAENGAWDDQDLVREVLARIVEPPSNYTAIFCDESQDFTRLELTFILRLSLFSRYDLSKVIHTQTLPFAFAGDPFQSINPSGFSWRQMGEIFYKAFEDEFGAITDKIRLNPLKDLNYNYRSSENIVRLSNTILLWRNYLFGSEITPQTYWGKKDDNLIEPFKFVLGPSSHSEEDLLKILEKVFIIVPCDEGGDQQFVDEDDLLKKLPRDERGYTNNVYSASRAKGLDFPKVVLYKFGGSKYFPEYLWGKNRAEQDLPEISILMQQYYINKLYVALTRAMKGLLILDTPEGDQRLWSKASADSINGVLESMDDNSFWESKVGALEHAQDFRGIAMTREEILEEANKLFREGKDEERGGVRKLFDASSWFRYLGISDMAFECEAWAWYFSDEYEKAGDKFLECYKNNDAWDSFWKASAFSKLLMMKNKYHRDKQLRAAEFYESGDRDFSALHEFSNHIREWLANKLMGDSLSSQWRRVIAKYVDRIRLSLTNIRDPEFWRTTGIVLERLNELGYPNTLSAAGDCYFETKEYKSAIRCYENAQTISHQKYYLAKANDEKYPGNLKWYKDAEEYDTAIQTWERNQGFDRQLPLDVCRLMAGMLQSKGRVREAARGYVLGRSLDDRVEVNNLIKQIFANKRDEIPFVESTFFFDYFLKHKLWNDLFAFAELALPAIQANHKNKFKDEFVYQLGRSPIRPEELSNETRNTLERYIGSKLTQKKWSSNQLRRFGKIVELLGFDRSIRFYDGVLIETHKRKDRIFVLERLVHNLQQKADAEKQRNIDLANSLLNIEIPKHKKEIDRLQREEELEQERKRQEEQATRESTLAHELIRILSPIQDLPDDIEIKKAGEDYWTFQVWDYEFRVLVKPRIVSVTNMNDGREMKIKVADLKVVSNDYPSTPLLLDDKNKVAFNITNFDFNIEIISEEEKRIVIIKNNKLKKPFKIVFRDSDN
jgi:hypothetical protein